MNQQLMFVTPLANTTSIYHQLLWKRFSCALENLDITISF